MHALILILSLTLSSLTWAKKCSTYDKLADYLNTKKFVQISKEHRLLKREPLLEMGDISQARSIAYKLPAFEDLGFGKPGGTGWSNYVGRHPKSGLNGKKIGWSVKNDQGHARVRLDWDPEKGAHYNIEITKKIAGKSETHKLAVSFLCGGVKCTEKQLLKIAEKMQ